MHGGDGGGGVCEVWGCDECMEGMGEVVCVRCDECMEGMGEVVCVRCGGVMSAWRGWGRWCV